MQNLKSLNLGEFCPAGRAVVMIPLLAGALGLFPAQPFAANRFAIVDTPTLLWFHRCRVAQDFVLGITDLEKKFFSQNYVDRKTRQVISSDCRVAPTNSSTRFIKNCSVSCAFQSGR